MAKHKTLTALEVAYMMGLTPPAKTATDKDIEYGIKARVGQYTQRYTRECPLPESGRISKGTRARHERAHGTEGMLDLSAVINSRRSA